MMKKKFFLFALIVFASYVTAWANGVPMKISGTILNTTSKEVTLSQMVSQGGFSTTSKIDKDGAFQINTNIPQDDYFALQIEEGSVYLVIRENGDLKIYADAKDLGQFTNIVGSDESVAFNGFIYAASIWNQQRNAAIQRMQSSPDEADAVNVEMQPIVQAFQQQFQEFFRENQSSPALLATLDVVSPDNDFATFETIVNSLNSNFGQSAKVQEIVTIYKQLKTQKDADNMFAPGKIAPDFEELMLDRKTKMKLSDLRGQVVLLDFWASWCGPCRRENPNVVAVYKKYKEKGFTVLSVSLDTDNERWKMAIEQDGLAWHHHVSDLKGWSSAVGKIYGVTGIPFALLIDKEGKIVASNLRGEELETAVANLLQ